MDKLHITQIGRYRIYLLIKSNRLVCYGTFTNGASNADLQNSILWYNTPIINSNI